MRIKDNVKCNLFYFNLGPVSSEADSVRQITPVPFVRVAKRRTTANKKERRRTQSINNAYADLRDCIPNVPADTKLSKVRYKTNFTIAYPNFKKLFLDQNTKIGNFLYILPNSSIRNGRTRRRFQSGIKYQYQKNAIHPTAN